MSQEQVYKLRKDELDLSINDTLLADEAGKRKITTNALLDAEVKPNPVTEEKMRTFYEQNKERVSGDFTQTKDAIRKYLEQIELRQAQRVFVEKLRAAASIQVFLVAPESPRLLRFDHRSAVASPCRCSGNNHCFHGLPVSQLCSRVSGSGAFSQRIGQ